jgi:pSer/pThr/pTyr-binding forkhead associated (FHA) protein
VQVVTQSAADAGRWSLQLGERFFALGQPVVRLGRALSNDVILEDRRVSRRHAQLRWRAGGYHLSDMGSSSGSSLNGRLVQPGQEVPLAEGDVISLAGLILKVHVRGGQPTT